MSYASALLTGAHPMRSDEDIPLDEVMAARTPAALAWGQLQGRLAHAPAPVLRFFSYQLIRTSLVDALQKSGFPSTESGLYLWFCGLDSLPANTSQETALPSQVADALLLELSLSSWSPLAEAAADVRRAGRYDRGHGSGGDPHLSSVLAQAKKITGRSKILIGKRWPLAVLDHMHSAAGATADFAPTERGSTTLSIPGGVRVVEQASSTPPLWALDLFAGQAVAAHIAGTVPLPCPGAYRSEALRLELWPNERGVLVADAAREAATALIRRVEEAYVLERALSVALDGLRTTSRALRLTRFLAAFGPLRPIQIETAFRLSKNGVREVIRTLAEKGLVRSTKRRGQSLMSFSSGAPTK